MQYHFTIQNSATIVEQVADLSDWLHKHGASPKTIEIICEQVTRLATDIASQADQLIAVGATIQMNKLFEYPPYTINLTTNKQPRKRGLFSRLFNRR